MKGRIRQQHPFRKKGIFHGWTLAAMILIGITISCQGMKAVPKKEKHIPESLQQSLDRVVQALKAQKNERQNRQIIIDYLGSPGWITPRDTAMKLCELGPMAAFAVPSLITVIDGHASWSGHYKQAQKEAMKAIGAIGDKASSGVPCLIRMLDHFDPELRKEAITALGKIGLPARSSADRLKKIVCFDSSASIRREAVTALGQMREPFSSFEKAFTDKSPDVRESAVANSISGELTSLPKLLSTLIAALSDQSAPVRKSACEALEKLGMAAQPAAPQLVAALDDPEYPVRKAAYDSLIAIAPNALPDLRQKLLANRLNDPERKERRQVILTLSDGSIQSSKSLPLLVMALKDRSRPVRLEAVKALGKLGVRSDEVVQALTEILRSDLSFQVRSEAAAALGLLGASEKSLEAGLKDRVPFVRLKALKALTDSDAPFFKGAFSWEAGSPDVAGYRVCYGVEAGEYPDCVDMGMRTEFRVDGLKLPKDKTYYFIVKSYNKAGESLASKELVMSQTHVAEIVEKAMSGEADARVKKEGEKALKKMILQGGP